MKRFILIHVLLLTILFTYSQQTKYTNTLLWKITGKGLRKPSFLYGTIHLTDKKVFFLGDSVYSAMDKVDGFASELDLNSMGMEIVNYMMKEKQEKQGREPIKVKDVVTPDIWQRYKSMLAEKLGKKAESITVDDLDDLEDELEGDMFKKGDMPTFLDAHLFGLAKKKGKWVGGIEDVEDQLEHMASDERVESKIQTALYDEDYYRKGIDWMIKVYGNEQLDSIDAMMYRDGSGLKDFILIKRNIKMARRMDSLSAIRSMFFAVGAAHLPGDSGVIAMLKSRGFQVTPVMSTKKIDPAKYVLKGTEGAWFPVEVQDNAYSLIMPGKADKFEYLEEMGLNTKMFFDLSFMRMYMTMKAELGEERKKVGADSLFSAFKAQYSNRSTNMKEKIISVNGEEGRELKFKTNEGYFTMQIFLPNLERVVINAIMSLKEPLAVEGDTKKFFESFLVNKDVKPKARDLKWASYKNSYQAFSIDFPTKPVEKKDVRSQEGKIIHNYQAVDLRSQIIYGISVSSVKEGRFWEMHDSSHYHDVVENLKSNFKDAIVVDSSFFRHLDFQSYKFTMTATNEGNKVVIRIFSILRGNRNYYLYTIYEPGALGQQQTENFFNSFILLPITYPDWTNQPSADKSFATTSPFPFRLVPTSNEEESIESTNTQRSIMYDTLASNTMYIDRIILPTWYWYKSDSALLYDRAQHYVQSGDSLINYKSSLEGKIRWAEFSVQKPEQQSVIEKVKIVVSGNEIYELFGHLSQQDLDKNYKKFFDDFKILKETTPLDINKPKFRELEEVIRKGNKKDINDVKDWWGDIHFSEKELPMLQSLMMTVYPDLDSTFDNTLNRKIIEQVEKVDSSHQTIEFIKNKYSSISKENEKVKPLLLSYLCGVTTKESYDLAKQILSDKNYPLDIDIYFPVYDSLRLTATLFPEFLKLAKKESMSGWVYGVTMTLLDSNLLTRKVLLDNEKQFIDRANTILKEKNKDDNVYDYDLVRILGAINNSSSNKLLAQFSKYSDREMKFVTLIAMLKNNLTVDPKNIYTLATTNEYRYDLYEELRKLKKLSQFPSDYLSQEKIGLSKLSKDAIDDEYALTIINAGSRTITYKGKSQKVYLYKVFESNDDDYVQPGEKVNYYLAVAGPFSTDIEDCYSTHELTGVYWEEEFDEKKIDGLLKKYIASLEESTKD